MTGEDELCTELGAVVGAIVREGGKVQKFLLVSVVENFHQALIPRTIKSLPFRRVTKDRHVVRCRHLILVLIVH